MPFFYEFHNEVIENTKIADIANLGKGRSAGSITAAEFLKFFAGDTNFIHTDIAGSSGYHKEFIAVMVRTLFNFAKDAK
jgi:leucyl aminopeptidase